MSPKTAPRTELVTVYATREEAAAWRVAADEERVGKLGSWVRRVGIDEAQKRGAERKNRVPQIIEPVGPIWVDIGRWAGTWNEVVKDLNTSGEMGDEMVRWIYTQTHEADGGIRPQLDPGPLQRGGIYGPVPHQIHAHLFPSERAQIEAAAAADGWGKSSRWLRAQASGRCGLFVVPRSRRVPLPEGWMERRRALSGVLTNIGQALDHEIWASDQRSMLEESRTRVGRCLARMREVETGVRVR